MRRAMRVPVVAAALAFAVSCQGSAPAANNLNAMLADSVFSIRVPGTTPTGETLGSGGTYDPGPGASPTQAFRTWMVDAPADQTYAKVLRQVLARGVTLTFASCSAAAQPDFLTDGWKEVGDRPTDVLVALQGTTLQISLSAPVGSPQVAPEERRIEYDRSCPEATDAVLRSMG